ncbi:MAG: hypothetical protein ACOC1X_04925, partial [Promethearchaeota archaeon]
LINLVKVLYPDVRKTIGVLQSNVSNGEIRDISYSTNSDLYEKIWGKMKEGDVEDVRKQLKSNYIDYPDLYNYIYSKVMDDPDEVKSPGEFMIEVGEALYRDNIVAIKEINFMSFMFKLLKESII